MFVHLSISEQRQICIRVCSVCSVCSVCVCVSMACTVCVCVCVSMACTAVSHTHLRALETPEHLVCRRAPE